jgi:hypothetical protein
MFRSRAFISAASALIASTYFPLWTAITSHRICRAGAIAAVPMTGEGFEKHPEDAQTINWK